MLLLSTIMETIMPIHKPIHTLIHTWQIYYLITTLFGNNDWLLLMQMETLLNDMNINLPRSQIPDNSK